MTSIQQEKKEFLQNHKTTYLINNYETCSCGYLLSGPDAFSNHKDSQWAKYLMAGYNEPTEILYERKNSLYEVQRNEGETNGKT